MVSKYKEFCQEFSFTQIIRSPTRISSNSSSLLDHILTNSNTKISNSGVIDTGLSDHQLIYCTRKVRRTKLNTHNQVLSRVLKNYSAEKFTDVLAQFQFPNYSFFSDANTAYSDFSTKLLRILNDIAPLKEKRIKTNTQEWFDREIGDQMEIRNKLLKKFKASKLNVDEESYKNSRRNVQHLITHKKRIYYENKLKENIGKPKELWKTLKSLGLPNKKSSSSTFCLKKDGALHFDSKTVSTIFKEFFSNLAENLVSKLPRPSNKFDLSSVISYYTKTLDPINTKFKFSTVSKDDILKILLEIKPEKAAGIDNISGKFLRDGATVIAKPISQICNLSIKQSTFPSDCKTAKLKLLFKKGSKTEAKNYRPISLLPIISKIIERVIHDQTQCFLDEKNIIFRYQSGFRKNYSTNLCLSYLSDKILKGFDSGLFTGMVLIDLQKAFDTINHDILLNKMYCFGFSEEVVSWFRSYLSQRQFKVNINEVFSDPALVTCGVPQGSILGPLLFLLYVNDIPQSVECELLLYADDTCLIFQHKKVEVIENSLNKDFANLCDWFVDNRLSIHLGEDKTKTILFGSKYKVKKAKPLNIVYGDINIKQYNKVTYLGCILDNTLSGESMALHVINKVNARLKFLYRQSKFLTKNLRRSLCNAMIQPFFDYASSVWYPNVNVNLRNRLQTAQNKCIRFCLNLGYREKINAEHFEEINWLKVNDRFSQSVMANVYNFFDSRCPEYMGEMFFPADQSGPNTRHSYKKLKIPSRRTNAGLNTLSYIGPSAWNKLPNVLKYSNNLNTFKHEVKKHFLFGTK